MAIKDAIKNGARFDSDTYSQKFFGISQNISTLKKGGNSITLSISQFVKPGSSVLVEILDAAGNPLKVTYPNKVSANKDYVIEIVVDDTVQGGRGEAFIRGTATKNPDTGQINQDGIPIIWYGIVDIKLEDDITTPTDPDDLILKEGIGGVTVKVTSKDVPYQNPDSSRHTNQEGTGTITYFPIVQSSNVSGNVSNKPEVLTSNVGSTIATVDGTTASSGKGEKLKSGDGFPTIVNTVAEFTADMVNGIITVTPDIANFIPPILVPTAGTVPTFTATILEVVNSTTITVDTHFSYKVPGAGAFSQGVLVDRFVSDAFSMEYNKSYPTSDSQKVTGYASLCFANTATSNGKIDKVKVSVKPVGAIGSPMEIGEFDPVPASKMVDTGSFILNPTTGLENKGVGTVETASDVTTYYSFDNYRIKKTASDTNFESIGWTETIGQSSTKLTNALTITSPAASDEVSVVTVQDAYAGNAVTDTEYTIKLDVYSEGSGAQMDVYFFGASVTQEGALSNFGTLVGTIDGGNGQTQKGLSYTVTTAEASDKIKPYLVIKSGTWHVAGLDLASDSSTGNSPNEICVDVPLDNLPVNKIGEEYVFVVDFIGTNGKPLGLDLVSQGIPMNVGTTIDEQLIINTFNSSPTIQQSITGSFTEVSSSFSTTITNVSSSFSTTITNVSSSFSTTITNVSSSLASDITNVSSSLASDITNVSSSLSNIYTDKILPMSGSLINDVDYVGTTLTLTTVDGTEYTTDINTSWTLITSPASSPAFPAGAEISGGETVTFAGGSCIGIVQSSPGNTLTVNHNDTSPLAAGIKAGSGVSSVTIDDYGHVTAVGSATYTGCLGTLVGLTAGACISIGSPSPGTCSIAVTGAPGITCVGTLVGLVGGTCITISSPAPGTCTINMPAAPFGITPNIPANNGTLTIAAGTGTISTGGSFTADQSGPTTMSYSVKYCPNTPSGCAAPNSSFIYAAPDFVPGESLNITQDYVVIHDSCCQVNPGPTFACWNRATKMAVSTFFSCAPFGACASPTSIGNGPHNITAGNYSITVANPAFSANQSGTTNTTISHALITPLGFTAGGPGCVICCVVGNTHGHITSVLATPAPAGVASVNAPGNWLLATSPSGPAVNLSHCNAHPSPACTIITGGISWCFDQKGHFIAANPSP